MQCNKGVKRKICACVIRSSKQNHAAKTNSLFASTMKRKSRSVPAVSSLPVHPSMSHILMMNNIREEDAGLGRGYCPSLLYPLRFGRICKIANKKLKAALPRLKAPNKTGWKVTTNSVAASLFGQQKVSIRGDAMMDWRKEQREKEKGRKWTTVSEERRQRKENERKWLSPWPNWEITGRNHHVLPFNPCSCSLTVSHKARIRQSAVVWKGLKRGGSITVLCVFMYQFKCFTEKPANAHKSQHYDLIILSLHYGIKIYVNQPITPHFCPNGFG